MIYSALLVGSLSGSLGGFTASRNAGGPYIRRRAIPIQPNTAGQQDVKARLSALSAAWASDLTQAQRTAWNTYGTNTPILNALGETILLQGRSWFVGNNVARLRAGLARVDAGPTTFGLPELTLPTMDADNGPSIDIGYTNTDSWATAVGGALLVQASKQKSPTVFFFKAPFLYVGRVNGAVTPPTSPAAFTAGLPSALTAGNAVWVRVRGATADGRLSAPIILRTIVVIAG